MRPLSAIPKTAVNISNNWQVSTETTSEEEINLMDSINQEMSDMRTENVPKKFTGIDMDIVLFFFNTFLTRSKC